MHRNKSTRTFFFLLKIFLCGKLQIHCYTRIWRRFFKSKICSFYRNWFKFYRNWWKFYRNQIDHFYHSANSIDISLCRQNKQLFIRYLYQKTLTNEKHCNWTHFRDIAHHEILNNDGIANRCASLRATPAREPGRNGWCRGSNGLSYGWPLSMERACIAYVR